MHVAISCFDAGVLETRTPVPQVQELISSTADRNRRCGNQFVAMFEIASGILANESE